MIREQRHPPTTPLGRLELLVGDDGSDEAAAATALAFRIAGHAHGTVTLVHVSPDLAHAPHAIHTAGPDALLAAAAARLDETAQWQRRLDNTAELAGVGTAVETLVRRGDAREVLLHEARAHDASMLLVGSTGVGRLRGMLLGSVASRLIERAPCPVLIYRRGSETKPAHVGSVVVGLDGSRESFAALPAAQLLAEALAAPIVLVSAFTVLAPSGPERHEAFVQRARGILEEARDQLNTDVTVVDEVVEGAPREALVDAAERHGPAVMVLGRRGAGGVKERLLGRTTYWAIEHAHCPVLVV